MESRKIQRSGTTYYLYLPASWCREHNISTDSVVYLQRSSKGDLVIEPKKTESSLSTLEMELPDNSPEVINKMIIAAYINPVKEFKINLKQNLEPDQILEHKDLLGGLELVDFEEDSINCQTSLALNDPDSLLKAMIKKILNTIKLLQKDSSHDLIKRYEEEIDKSNLLIQKSIITSLMHRRETKLRHVDLYYIGHLSRSLERISDLLITLEKNNKLIKTADHMMKELLDMLENITQSKVISFIKQVEKQSKVNVKNLETYKEKRLYTLLGHISEILCDWVITEEVDRQKT
mgnify:CR=1 FL=1|jgi:phosphate uptake regulator